MSSGIKPACETGEHDSHLKVLKPEDIEDADGSEVFTTIDTTV